MAMIDHAAAISAYLESRTGEIAGILAELVRIPTVNPYSGDAHPAGEAKGQRHFRRLLEEAGAGTVDAVPVPPDIYRRGGILGPRERSWAGRENLVGRFAFGDGGGPVVVLNGHMDTVGVDDYEGEPFSGRLEGGCVHGRGASDCKGSLVAGLFALRALRASGAPLRGRVLFESVVDEECNGGGAGTLACCLAGVAGDYAICLDGMHGLLYTGCQGLLTVEIAVRGGSGHGSLGGVSAVDKLLLVKGALDRLGAERAPTGCAVNIGVLRAGSAPWTLPRRGSLIANINSARHEATDAPFAHGARLRARLEALVGEVADADDWLREHRPEIVWVKDLPPYGPEDMPGPTADRLLAAAQASCTEAFGAPPAGGDLPAWCDAAHLARIGRMPVVGIGAAAPGASHATVEFNRLDNVRIAADAIARTLLRLMR